MHGPQFLHGLYPEKLFWEEFVSIIQDDFWASSLQHSCPNLHKCGTSRNMYLTDWIVYHTGFPFKCQSNPKIQNLQM